MSVYTFVAQRDNGEHHTETGCIVAQNRLDAFDKLKKRHMILVRLKRLTGLNALIKKWMADIR